MKNSRFGSYPGLCLCLLFSIGLLSCGTAYQQERGKIAAFSGVQANDTAYWELEVRLLPNHFDFGTNAANLRLIVPPYDIRNAGESGTSGDGLLIIRYRLSDSLKVIAVENALLSEGNITGMRITKITK